MAQALKAPEGAVVLVLSKLEARGLYALANEGACGLFEDAEAGKAYIGNARARQAARDALTALGYFA